MPPTPPPRQEAQETSGEETYLTSSVGGDDLVPGYIICKSQCKMKTGALV